MNPRFQTLDGLDDIITSAANIVRPLQGYWGQRRHCQMKENFTLGRNCICPCRHIRKGFPSVSSGISVKLSGIRGETLEGESKLLPGAYHATVIQHPSGIRDPGNFTPDWTALNQKRQRQTAPHSRAPLVFHPDAPLTALSFLKSSSGSRIEEHSILFLSTSQQSATRASYCALCLLACPPVLMQ